ncbi:DUF4422 domain-containing protein [Candidatus Pelagibacter sp.]|jgi:hypothetical protein|nr:DUF4422 domain-containing protein [Candidatus Pelagibacter sp.]
MSNAKMYCLCLKDSHLEKVKKLNYHPVGLGSGQFSENWIRDNTETNISSKNPFYGEYTFHYWLWKNYLNKIQDNTWIGFCTYRRFWQNKHAKSDQFNDQIIKEIPKEWKDYEVILADKIDLTHVKWIKILKYGKKAFLKNPKSIFKKYRNIKFQFDLNHGVGSLDRAIELLTEDDKDDFKKFVLENTSFNQCNLFMCKSKNILENYYKTIFEWLNKCEKEFGFNDKTYGKVRIYGFLAERFMPYWFRKNSKFLEWPIIFHDLDNENLQ